MDFIEFVTHVDHTTSVFKESDTPEGYSKLYSLVLIQASTIVLIEAVSHEYCIIHTNQGKQFKVSGNYRCNTNRVFYAMQKNKIINMAILKPSDYFYHRIEELGNSVDNLYYDVATLQKLKKILESDLFQYRGINTLE